MMMMMMVQPLDETLNSALQVHTWHKIASMTEYLGTIVISLPEFLHHKRMAHYKPSRFIWPTHQKEAAAHEIQGTSLVGIANYPSNWADDL
jgi:hypothetical protein